LLLRSLFFLVLAYFLYHIIRGLLAAPKRPNSRDKLGPSEDMVLDPQCQSYLPKNEALVRGGNYFCSENCARAFLSH
jgi:hypothetical protein